MMLNLLPGKKTYIAAFAAILVAVGTWLAGDMSLGDMIQTVTTAAIGAFLRKGVASTAGQ